VSYLLHPPVLDEGGLCVALRAYVDGFSERTGIRVDLDVSADLGRMRPNVELVLFRVSQEALTNIWRHSGSSTARIQLLRQVSEGVGRITLTIEDAGKGIPSDIRRLTMSSSKSAQHTPSGVGLVGMRERLHQIGGRLEIESTTGKTVIRAIVPLQHEAGRGAS
jgi:signal transduction histidine kinase